MWAVILFFEKIKFDLPGNRDLKYTSAPWGKNALSICYGLQEVQRDGLKIGHLGVLVYYGELKSGLTAKVFYGVVNLCTSFFGQSSPKIKSSLINGGGTHERDDFDDVGDGCHAGLDAADDGRNLDQVYGVAGNCWRMR
jgi:hypothetical protein